MQGYRTGEAQAKQDHADGGCLDYISCVGWLAAEECPLEKVGKGSRKWKAGYMIGYYEGTESFIVTIEGETRS